MIPRAVKTIEFFFIFVIVKHSQVLNRKKWPARKSVTAAAFVETKRDVS